MSQSPQVKIQQQSEKQSNKSQLPSLQESITTLIIIEMIPIPTIIKIM